MKPQTNTILPDDPAPAHMPDQWEDRHPFLTLFLVLLLVESLAAAANLIVGG